MQVHPNDPKSPAFTFQTALRLVYRIQTACEAARVDEKNFPCRSASLPGATPTSAATLLAYLGILPPQLQHFYVWQQQELMDPIFPAEKLKQVMLPC